MFVAHRTPAKKGSNPNSPQNSDQAGPAPASKVRRSIGEWEAGKAEPNQKLTPAEAGTSKAKTKQKLGTTLSQESRPLPTRVSTDASKSPPTKTVYPSRVAEARNCLNKAKLHLGNSRNLRTDIKLEVTSAIDRLYQLVKEAEAEKANNCSGNEAKKTMQQQQEEEKGSGDKEEELPQISQVFSTLAEQTRLVKENNERLRELQSTVEALARDEVPRNDDQVLKEIRALEETTQKMGKMVTELQDRAPTYAETLKVPRYTKEKTTHSVIVSSEVSMDTSSEVMGKVRRAIDAKESGLQIGGIRQARDKRVILSFHSKEEMTKTSAKLKGDKNLKVEEAKNKDPLVIIRDVFSYNSDEEVIACLRSQNRDIFGDIPKEDQRLAVGHRRKARNPHKEHIILRVAPRVWQRLTAAEKVHIDLQRVLVEDQSPLTQCSLCLGYGHSRRFCQETELKCSHCGGKHMSADCADRLSGEPPQCCNCTRAGLTSASHTAFSMECPVRRKWDEIARASVAYC